MADDKDRHEIDSEDSNDREERAAPSPADRQAGGGVSQVLTGDQGGDDNFGGRTGSGTSAMAANNSRDDLGAIGPAGIESGGTPGAFVAGSSDDSSEYLQEGTPKTDFAEQGRGGPEGSGPEGTGERTANRDSDIEGSSKN